MHIYVEKIYLDKNIKHISDELEIKITFTRPDLGSYLIYDTKGLSFIQDAVNSRQLIYIDFLKGKLGWRIKRAQHESNLKKALGKTKHTLNIFDATAGFLSDSMIFLSLGHKVTAVEQSKIVFYLVHDALKRAQTEIPFIKNLTLINGDSVEIYKNIEDVFDVIYLDPMYPPNHKSAKGSGDIKAIKSILKLENISNEEDDICDAFMKDKYQKIILKRPLKSKKNYSNINYQVRGKTTRFDIFI